ncbi:MAG: pantoate--beta-alanine ligase [Sphingobacteriales bacterium]|nr:pantoate--beta-alanine ligase [Sphingobacteriales bacterium]
MILFKKAADLRKWLETQRKADLNIGFVPTMGALHAGHISLLNTSKNRNDITVASIFVNPTQFNDPKDFEKYPITIEKDIDLLEEAGCDVLFLPSVSEIYPHGIEKAGHFDLGYFETILEGKYRPGHFQGVCMVVQRLLEIVMPHKLYLGQKDYQQCMVIGKLIELTGLKGSITMTVCPTLREKDGLAMSSRNMRLNEQERKTAIQIFKTLSFLKENIKPGNPDSIKKDANRMLIQAGFKPDYVEIADADNLAIVNDWDGKQKLVALIAAFLNEVRLIDNMLLN